MGSGGWGLALAICAAENSHDVTVWTPFPDEANTVAENREHKSLLPGVKIPEEIRVTTDLREADGSDLAVLAVPSFAVRETAAKLRGVRFGAAVNVAKGLERESCLRLSEVIREELPGADLAVLSGPSHAEEVARRIPTAVTVASDNPGAAALVQRTLSNGYFRIYTNTDIIGVELGGALKNVIAVAAGFLDGAGLGDNTKAALITRGLAEIARLGVACGGRRETFMGLAGLGDLVVTCTSVHSRNHRFGEKVGRGAPVKEALADVGTVEGYFATEAGAVLAAKKGVSMPILEECHKVLFEGEKLENCVARLMSRDARPEEDTLYR